MTGKPSDAADAASRAARHRAERVAALELLRRRMVADETVSGATLIFGDGTKTYVSRADLMRWRPGGDA